MGVCGGRKECLEMSLEMGWMLPLDIPLTGQHFFLWQLDLREIATHHMRQAFEAGSKVRLLPKRDSDLFLALKESRRDSLKAAVELLPKRDSDLFKARQFRFEGDLPKAGKWRAVDWFGQRSGGW